VAAVVVEPLLATVAVTTVEGVAVSPQAAKVTRPKANSSMVATKVFLELAKVLSPYINKPY
jgi:hypothetical protein